MKSSEIWRANLECVEHYEEVVIEFVLRVVHCQDTKQPRQYNHHYHRG